MKQEPVAWLHKPSGMIFDEIVASVEPNDLIPLYTAPKQLSDDEIAILIAKRWGQNVTLYDFARDVEQAILKKANEK